MTDERRRFRTLDTSHFDLITYIICRHQHYYPIRDQHTADIVKSYDRELHQSLDKLFRESFTSSDQIKEFLRGRQHIIDSRIKLQIPEQTRIPKSTFLRETLGKFSLLWIAIFAGYWDSAELLVRSGADVGELCESEYSRLNRVFYSRRTVLHVLLQMHPCPENERLIRLVVDHGADLEAREAGGRTALHIAVREDRVQMIEMLLEKGADLQARDFGGKTALHLAASKGKVQVTEMLLEKGAEVNGTDDKGATPLLKAANSSEAAELLPLLMKHGADVSVRDKHGHNVLHNLRLVSDERHLAADLVRVLIEKGCSLDDRVHDSSQFQPIHQAALKGNNELVNIYLDHGANVNSLAYDVTSPLHLAVIHCNMATVETLLKRGATVDLKNDKVHKSRTALHEACVRSSYGTIKFLVSAGANVLVEDDNGMTPFALIGARGYTTSSTSSLMMIKSLALEKNRQPSIELKDERIIEGYPKLWDYYRDCIEQIEKAKSTRFVKSCTFFDLLKKCHWQIAALMRNPEFESKFKLCDLSEFSMYAEDIALAFERAEKYHCAMLKQESVIDEAVYGILPYLVVRRVVHYALL